MLLSDEICRSLFEERVRNTSNAFFPNAARDLLSSLLICLIREAQKDKAFLQNLYNNELRELIDGCDAEMLRGILNTYPDMRGISSYIEGRGSQSQGVIAELFSVIREVFVGVFAQKGGFSMRNFVRSKGRKVLYIEYDLSIGSVLTPVYRILFDMALKEALGRQNSQGNVYLICDEFKLLPNLQHIEDGVNFGRSLGVKILAGIQSIEQLYESYQEMRGRNIAAGFSSIFAFKANDAGSRDYVSGLLGKNMVLERYTSTGAQYVEEKRIGQVVEDWELGSLGLGEAVVCLPFQPPFRFQFDLYR
jgi:type IV secretory pathway TraG/TraD family ATPase VirD4